MSSRDPMTELAVTMEQLIEAVKALSAKLDKLQEEKVQGISERLAVVSANIGDTNVTTVMDRVSKLERVVYGTLFLIVGQIIGVVIWLLKK